MRAIFFELVVVDVHEGADTEAGVLKHGVDGADLIVLALLLIVEEDDGDF